MEEPNIKEFKNSPNLYENKPLSCPICEFNAPTLRYLVLHMRIHSGERPYACKQCDYKSEVVCHLVRHKRTHMGENLETLKCDVRPAVACDLDRKRTGEKRCTSDESGRTAANTVHVNKQKKRHDQRRPFACSLCAFKGKQANHLRTHMEAHTGQNAFVCDLCSYRTTRSTAFEIHQRTHTGEKPFACSKCDYRARQSGLVKTHMRINHIGTFELFECQLCDYKAKLAQALKMHMKSHQKVTTY